MLNSVLYAGAGALLGTLFAAMCGYALAKYRVPRSRARSSTSCSAGCSFPRRRSRCRCSCSSARFSRPTPSGRCSCPASSARSASTSPASSPRPACPTNCSRPRASTAPARCARSSPWLRRLMTPALVTIFLFQFVAIWNNFFLPLIMLRDQTLFPVTLGLYTWNIAGRTRSPRSATLRHRRRLPVDHPAHHRLPQPAALLARRPRRGKRQVAATNHPCHHHSTPHMKGRNNGSSQQQRICALGVLAALALTALRSRLRQLGTAVPQRRLRAVRRARST